MFSQIAQFAAAPVIVYQAVAPTILSSDDDGQTVTGILFYDADGGVRIQTESSVGGTITTNQASWSSLHPNEALGANWSVRIRFISGDNTYTSGSGLNAWLVLSSNRNFTFTAMQSGPSSEIGQFSAELSDDGGATIFDGPNNFTVTLTNDSP